jgi:hypothetical protein
VSAAALQVQNLLYLLGALVAAGVWIAGLYLLRHRKPKSIEASIESFNRELRALAPPPGRPAASGSGNAASLVARPPSGDGPSPRGAPQR